MSKTEKEKLNALAKMFKDLGKVLGNLPDSSLKSDYSRFLDMMSSGTVTLDKILEVISKKIDKAGTSKAKTVDVPSKTVIGFWKGVAKIIVDAYREARGDND